MKQVKVFIFALGIALGLLSCDIGSLLGQVLPASPMPMVQVTTRAIAQPTRVGTPAAISAGESKSK